MKYKKEDDLSSDDFIIREEKIAKLPVLEPWDNELRVAINSSLANGHKDYVDIDLVINEMEIVSSMIEGKNLSIRQLLFLYRDSIIDINDLLLRNEERARAHKESIDIILDGRDIRKDKELLLLYGYEIEAKEQVYVRDKKTRP